MTFATPIKWVVAFLGTQRQLSYQLNLTSFDENTNLLIVCLTNEVAQHKNIEKARKICGKTNQGGFMVVRYNFGDVASEESCSRVLRQVKCAL